MIEDLAAEEVVLLAGIGAALLVMLLAIGGGVVYALSEPRRQVRRRMDRLGLQRAGADGAAVLGGGGDRPRRSGGNAEQQTRQRRIQEKLRELEKAKENRARRRNRLRQSLMRAGLRMDYRVYLVIALVLGLVSGGAVIVVGLPLLVGLLVGVTMAFGVPRLVLGVMAGLRQKRFTNEFPNALDVLVRGVQSGLPISECITIVGREVPDPVGAEFRMMVEGQRLGLGLNEIMARGLERMPTAEYKFFAIVLQIQQQTGGNLAETLANLSQVIRDRKQMRSKVKALSAEAKASAWIIGSLPFIVVALISMSSPEYMQPLFEEQVGHFIIAGGLFWMLVGIGIMTKMIKFKM